MAINKDDITNKNEMEWQNLAGLETKTLTNKPNHIAFILDGNRRWAKKNGLSPNKGHKKGAENIENLCNWCMKYEIKFLTLYCLSIENLNRSKNELKYLFTSIKTFLTSRRIEEYNNRGINISVIGDFSVLPQDVRQTLEKVNQRSIEKPKLFLQLCIGYSGRNEIVNAVKKAIQINAKADEINEKTFEKLLFTSNIPDVDFLIRTGGDMRISNFLLWKISYAELYFCKQFFPEFNEKNFLLALYDFQDRMRRYGR